jgi:hypothetical protein
MSWITKHQRVWRVVILVLLLIAMLGPWTFDRTNVPAEFPCSAPHVRLEGDFCGTPLSGMWIFASLMGVLIDMVARSIMGSSSLPIGRAFLFLGLGLLLFAAPFSSTLLLTSGAGRRRVRCPM